MRADRLRLITRVFLRWAIGLSFLAACGDRFGFFGAYGTRNVAWGDWSHFAGFVAVLNWYLPSRAIPALAAIETGIELALGIALLTGIRERVVAFASAALLLSFALTMSVALGVLAPLSYSVFTAAGGALLLATTADAA